MFVYIPMIILSLGLAWIAVHVKKGQQIYVYSLSCFMPIVVAMFRYNNGADYLMYLNMMSTLQMGGTISTVKTIEIGFEGLTKILVSIFHNQYFIVFGIYSLIICGFMYAGIKQQSSNVTLSVFLFFATGTYFDSFNGLRQYIATAIILFSMKYIYEQNFKKYIMFLLIATLFHYSAIIMFPVYFIRKIKIDLKKALVIAVVCIIAGDMMYQFITFVLQFTRYKYFLTSIEYEVIGTQASILCVTIVSLLTYGYQNMFKVKVSSRLQIMMNIQLLVWCSTLLSLFIPLIWRVQYYFLPFELIYIPCFLSEISKKNTRVIMAGLIVALYASVTLYGIIQNDWYTCFPYNFYFDYMN